MSCANDSLFTLPRRLAGVLRHHAATAEAQTQRSPCQQNPTRYGLLIQGRSSLREDRSILLRLSRWASVTITRGLELPTSILRQAFLTRQRGAQGKAQVDELGLEHRAHPASACIAPLEVNSKISRKRIGCACHREVALVRVERLAHVGQIVVWD